jgi:ADP-ribose pyrophosphatase
MAEELAMRRLLHLPSPPLLRLEILEDRSSETDGFLRRRSHLVRLREPDGTPTEALVYDEVDREAIDAVVVAAHFLGEDEAGNERRFVVLRSAARPPIMGRDATRSPIDEPDNRGLWELPAGLVEPDEQSRAGLLRCASRELEEETGFAVEPSQLEPLGPPTYPAPGMVAERHFFFEVEVDPRTQREPSLDGSPLEQVGQLIAIPLTTALQAAREGHLEDAKTELGLRRLVERWGDA